MGGVGKAVSGVIGSILGGGEKPKTPDPIPVSEPEEAPVPLPDEEAQRAARKKAAAKARTRSGRLSTILDSSTDTLGD